MIAVPAGIVCITGCSRGLGRAMALEFARLGWKVAGCARTADSIATLAEELGNPHIFQAVDVTDDAAMHSFAKTVIGTLGAPNLLVNNAALINGNAPLKDISPEEFAKIFAVNLGGVHNSIRAFLPAMENNGEGVIVNFSSYWGHSTAPEVAPYCATKWAIEGLTQSLSQELPSGLAAVAFNPGIIDTDMLRSCFGEAAARYHSSKEWATIAVSQLVGFSESDNGKSVNY
jgi:NAD(P)-dependent dehydrogenase (short-subunit alcohol dehydrogenase family)